LVRAVLERVHAAGLVDVDLAVDELTLQGQPVARGVVGARQRRERERRREQHEQATAAGPCHHGSTFFGTILGGQRLLTAPSERSTRNPRMLALVTASLARGDATAIS